MVQDQAQARGSSRHLPRRPIFAFGQIPLRCVCMHLTHHRFGRETRWRKKKGLHAMHRLVSASEPHLFDHSHLIPLLKPRLDMKSSMGMQRSKPSSRQWWPKVVKPSESRNTAALPCRRIRTRAQKKAAGFLRWHPPFLQSRWYCAIKPRRSCQMTSSHTP